MYELMADDVAAVGGGLALNYTTNITLGMLNSVDMASRIGGQLGLAFSVGYAIGTFLYDNVISDWLWDN
jgi:hypothetical protein